MFARAFALIAFIAATVMGASIKSTCDNGTPGYTHVVVAKDTCSAIAAQGGVSVSRLEAANPGINCDNLHIGERVCVPRNT